MFGQNKDYAVPLLRILAEFGSQPTPVPRIYQAFEEHYGDSIPPEHRGKRKNGMVIWQHIVAWQRHDLTDRMGFVATPGRGEWQITPAGLDWLAQHPDAQHVELPVRRGARKVSKPSISSTRSAPMAAPAGITLKLLEETRQGMAEDQFRRLWGALYDQLAAVERAKAISDVSEREIGRRAWQQVHTIHTFLQGRSEQMPTSETLCDWIHYCYTLELHREVVALWKMVQQESVNPWQYERTQKMVRASQVRLGR
jgi:hypothetical protein